MRLKDVIGKTIDDLIEMSNGCIEIIFDDQLSVVLTPHEKPYRYISYYQGRTRPKLEPKGKGDGISNQAKKDKI